MELDEDIFVEYLVYLITRKNQNVVHNFMEDDKKKIEKASGSGGRPNTH